jgi:hypothetical protein
MLKEAVAKLLRLAIQRLKVAQNAHLLDVNCAFSQLFALSCMRSLRFATPSKGTGLDMLFISSGMMLASIGAGILGHRIPWLGV